MMAPPRSRQGLPLQRQSLRLPGLVNTSRDQRETPLARRLRTQPNVRSRGRRTLPLIVGS
jgi:hypothetical protein